MWVFPLIPLYKAYACVRAVGPTDITAIRVIGPIIIEQSVVIGRLSVGIIGTVDTKYHNLRNVLGGINILVSVGGINILVSGSFANFL